MQDTMAVTFLYATTQGLLAFRANHDAFLLTSMWMCMALRQVSIERGWGWGIGATACKKEESDYNCVKCSPSL